MASRLSNGVPIAGQRLQDALGQGLVIGALPGVYSLYDWVSGDTQAFNSGEIPMNTALGVAPLAGLVTGAVVPGLANKAVQPMFFTDDPLEMQLWVASDPAGAAQAMAAVNEEMKRLAAAHPGAGEEELRGRLRHKLIGRVRLGANAGAAVGSAAAILAMMDQASAPAPAAAPVA